jgi:hypothetical protein
LKASYPRLSRYLSHTQMSMALYFMPRCSHTSGTLQLHVKREIPETYPARTLAVPMRINCFILASMTTKSRDMASGVNQMWSSVFLDLTHPAKSDPPQEELPLSAVFGVRFRSSFLVLLASISQSTLRLVITDWVPEWRSGSCTDIRSHGVKDTR